MSNTQAKLEQLFEFTQELRRLLESEEYELFNQQQALFGDLLKDFLTKSPESELVKVIEQLKNLQNVVKSLQQQADIATSQLKEQSLSLQRNKNKIKAYK